MILLLFYDSLEYLTNIFEIIVLNVLILYDFQLFAIV